ncbi:hypothetical protein C1N91_02530 [Curtobacterium sp. SGAir0471]|nr:hypothetical protein C1N91_02530 [Curtobacterium sp. SGAir0471]
MRSGEMSDDSQRPGDLAPYGAGLLAVPFGLAVFVFKSLAGLADGSSDAVIDLSIAIGAPITLVIFGLLTTIPRRRREARLRITHPRAALVNVIVTPAARRELRLEDALRRSYTATFVFEPGSVTLWKRGSKPVCVATVVSRGTIMRATSMRHGGNRVAALELALPDVTLVVPVIKSGAVFNMPTGYEYIEKLCRSAAERLAPEGNSKC